MPRTVPKKVQTMAEINALLGLEVILPTIGSSIPSVFFSNIAAEMGIPIINGMPTMARKIIEGAHLNWHDSFSSESTPSGGGGTVTALGLLQVKNAVLVWLDKPTENLPGEIIFEEWTPDPNWLEKRKALPREVQDVLTRPGASEFRQLVLTEYDGQCAVTGYKVPQAIEVAHIVPYFGPESDDIQNALPLRTDIHRLFDKGLIRIEYRQPIRKYVVRVHDSIMADYSKYEKALLLVPKDPLSAPSNSAHLIQQKLFSEMWTII